MLEAIEFTRRSTTNNTYRIDHGNLAKHVCLESFQASDHILVYHNGPGYAAATVKRLACATVEPGIQAKPSECDLQGTICVKDERVDMSALVCM